MGKINGKEVHKPGYKHTILGWIPDDWEVKQLGDIGELKNGVNKDKDEFGYGSPFVNLINVFGISRVSNNVSDLGLVNVTEKERVEYSLKKGDVLFVRSSVKPEGVGLTTLICNDIAEATYSGFLIRFRDGGFLELDYKAHCFFEARFRRALLNKSTISANTNINQVALKSLLIPVPPKQEQRRIANVLNCCDEAILKTTRLTDLRRERKKALMQQLLTGKKRLPGFDSEWKEKKLGELFSERNDCGRTELPLLSITAERGVIYQSESDKKNTSNEDKSKYKRICVGDIGYNTMRMWQGRSALSRLEGLVSPAYTVVVPKIEADAEYFSYLFKTEHAIHSFFQNSQGLVDDTLNCKFKDFAIVKVKVPPTKEEQIAIATVLRTADGEIQLLQKKLSALKKQKKALMQQLLTGKKRVKV